MFLSLFHVTIGQSFFSYLFTGEVTYTEIRRCDRGLGELCYFISWFYAILRVLWSGFIECYTFFVC